MKIIKVDNNFNNLINQIYNVNKVISEIKIYTLFRLNCFNFDVESIDDIIEHLNYLKYGDFNESYVDWINKKKISGCESK